MAVRCTSHLQSAGACSPSRFWSVRGAGVEIETPLRVLLGDQKGAILSRERIAPFTAHPCGTQGIPVPQRDKTFLAKGPITPPAALPTVITSRYKTARPLHAPPIVK